MEKIDFVLPWVDGNDKEWIDLKRKYESSVEILSKSNPEVNDASRYRDYGLLKYWFRGVDRFAPWVNRVFFVTCGQNASSRSTNPSISTASARALFKTRRKTRIIS